MPTCLLVGDATRATRSEWIYVDGLRKYYSIWILQTMQWIPMLHLVTTHFLQSREPAVFFLFPVGGERDLLTPPTGNRKNTADLRDYHFLVVVCVGLWRCVTFVLYNNDMIYIRPSRHYNYMGQTWVSQDGGSSLHLFYIYHSVQLYNACFHGKTKFKLMLRKHKN